MRLLVPLLLLAASLAWSQCPLGLTPEEACGSSSPICRLFNDIDGDSICDNPASGGAEEPDTATTPPVEEPDTSSAPPVEAPDTVSAEEPTDSVAITPESLPELGETPVGNDTVSTPPVEQPDTTSTSPVETPSDALVAAPVDAGEDSLASPVNRCPLGYTPPEACSADSPGCALFVDADGDSLCDNPGPQLPPDSVIAAPDTTARRVIAVNGCPLSLPPAAACPFERRLCPHYLGWSVPSSCLNPSHGLKRGTAVLAITATLLVAATFLSRKIRGRRNRKKAKISRTTVLVLSLLLLGFALQGCYCPLGLYQFMLVPGMLAGVLGWIGFVIVLLPIVHALFFGRIYCGWVCPMGALQELLARLPVHGRPKLPHRLASLMILSKYLTAAVFSAAVVLAGRGVIDAKWSALFCSVDPFHTVFSLFLSGSLLVAVLLVILSIFFGRFFCRYLCFYGAILKIACKAGLWTRLRRLMNPREVSCDLPAGEGSCELGNGED